MKWVYLSMLGLTMGMGALSVVMGNWPTTGVWLVLWAMWMALAIRAIRGRTP